LIATLSGFYRRRPALQSIAEARLLPPSVTADVRQRLRREIAVAIQAFSPGIAKDRAETAAVVVYELMKSARLIETEPRLRHRASAASDIKSTLESYLASLAREAVARG
jgi:hypothetical protein